MKIVRSICAKALLYIAGLLSVSFVESCQRRPLEDADYNTKINVKVNIKSISNVTCDIYNPNIPVPEIDPEVMHVLFYGMEDGNLVADSFISNSSSDSEGNKSISGNVSILPGDYKMIIYQFGEEHTLLDRYDNFSDFYAYTDPLSDADLRSLALKSTYTESGQLLRYQPDHCVVTSSEKENIPYHQGVYTIESEASSLVETYYLQVGVNGGEYISSARAVLTSMAPSKKVTNFAIDKKDPCALYIPLVKSDDKGHSVVCNVFNTFGHVPDLNDKLYISFDIQTSDGRTVEKEYDITELFQTEDAVLHHWLIIDDVIDIPAPPTPDPGGGGFDPTVDDWEEVNHTIIM